jgi:AcrR family transcriptional regulator
MSEPAPASGRADARRNHDAVVAAAIALLTEDPAVSMTAIADASGVTRTTVYRHFPTRDALLRAVFARVHAEFVALGEEAVGAGTSAADTLRQFAREVVPRSERYRFLTGYRALAEEVFDDEQLIEGDGVLAWLRAAHARGELRPETPPEWQFRMLRSLVTAACQEVLAGRADAERAGLLLGDTLVAALVAEG